MSGRITWQVFLGAVGMAIIVLFLLAVLFLSRSPYKAQGNAPTAILTLIFAPSSTPLPLPTYPITQTPSIQPNGGSGQIQIGSYVQISGTGGDGLRLRAGPSISQKVEFLAAESEVFQIKDGPKDSDGYTWWFLTTPYDEKRTGWAVANYLVIVPASQ